MREVDRRTIEAGIPGIVLHGERGDRVIEFLVEKFAPLENHRIVGAVAVRQQWRRRLRHRPAIYTRFKPQRLDVVLPAIRTT